MADIEKSVLVGYSASQMFALVDGVETYPDFLPWCGGSSVRHQSETVTHATIMIIVTLLAITDLIWRLNDYHTELVTPSGIAVLSVVIAALVSLGATFGGTLVYDYGFNVENSTDHPVWHVNEQDVLPGQKG